MSEQSAEYIRKFIYDRRWTKVKFSKISGVSRFTLYKYLKGGNVHPKAALRIQENIKNKTVHEIDIKKLID